MPENKKILIIDNDLVIRYTLKKIFSNYLASNLKIYTSSDGLQGLGYVYVVRPDLIIIDATLPKYSGRELTEYIRTNSTLKTTPVILLNEEREFITGLPENFIQISKTDRDFPESLVNIVSKILEYGTSQKNEAIRQAQGDKYLVSETKDLRHLLVNFLAKKILRYSNISDIESQKVLSKNIIIKSAYYLKYLFDQFLISVYLTNFYILVGKKDYEETVDQKTQDIERFRVKTFPALAFGLALIFFGIIQFFLLSGVFVALTYVATSPAYAASYTWDGGGTDGTCGGQAGDGNKWSCAANWSSDIVPTAADSITFNSTSTKDSTIDASFGGTVTSLTIATGYSGTITVSRSFTMSTSFSQATGTFNGGNQTITDSGTFTLSGGTFTSTSGTFNLANSLTVSGSPTFNNNSGVFAFTGIGTHTCNNIAFNRVTIASTNSITFNASCTLPLGNNPSITIANGYAGHINGTLTGTGTLTFSGAGGTYNINTGSVISGFTGWAATGTINLAGTVPAFTTFTHAGGNFTIMGTSLDLSGVTAPNFGASLIMSSGSLKLPTGTTNVVGNLTFSGGTFDANGGIVNFATGSGGTLSCNNVTFNLVTITGPSKIINSNCTLPMGNNPGITTNGNVLNGTISGTGSFNIALNAALTVNSGATISGFTGMSGPTGSYLVLNGGTFPTFTSFSIGNLTIAGATLNLGSSSPTTIYDALAISSGSFTAPSGTLVLGSSSISGGALTISGSPTFNANGGTFNFTGNNATLTCANVIFNLVTFTGSNGAKTVGSTCNLPLGNNPTLPNTMSVILNGILSGTGTFTLAASNNTLTMNSGSSFSGFTGFSGPRIFNVAGATANFTSYTSFVVAVSTNVSSGTLSLPTNASLGNVSVTGGTLNGASGVMNVAGFGVSGSGVFNGNGGTVNLTFAGIIDCGGTTSFNLVTFSNLSGNGTNTINSNCNLPLGNNPNVGGRLIINGTLSGTGLLNFTNQADSITMNSGSVFSGFTAVAVNQSITFAGMTANFSSYTAFSVGLTTTLSAGTLTLPNGADLNGALVISGGTFNAPSGNMTVAGALTISGSPVFNHNGGTVTFDGGTSVTLSCNNVVFNNVVFAHTGGFVKTVNSNCTLPLGNNPSIPFGIILSGILSGTGTLTNVAGGIIVNSGGNFSGFNSSNLAGLIVNAASLDLSSYTSFVTSAGACVGFTSNSCGTTSASPSSLILPSNPNINGSLFVSSNGTYNQAAGSLTVGLGLQSAGTITLPSSVSIGSTLTISGGTFNAPSGTMSIVGALTVSGTPTFNHNNGTVSFGGAASAVLSCNNITFNRVVFNSVSSVTKTVNSNCSMPLGNNPDLGLGSLNLNGTLTGTGTLNKNGTVTINTGSTITGFSGYSGSAIIFAGATLDLSSYTTFALSNGLNVTSGSLTLPAGATIATGGTISGGTLTMGSSGTFNGILTINGGTFNAPSGILNQGGSGLSLTSGTFNHNNGTVVFTGGNQTITGAFTFKNFTKTNTSPVTLTLQSNTTQTVLGALTLKGTAGDLLSLRSSAIGTQSRISAASVDIAYLDVKDNNNTGSSVIQAAGKNITNSGNNTRWNFDNPSITSVGPQYLTNGSNISNNRPSYTFNITDPQASDTVRFQIQIDNNSDFATPEVDYTSALQSQGGSGFTVGQAAGTGTYTTGSENQSLADASYYVRIKGIDSTGGDGGYSTINTTNSAFTVDTTKPTGSVFGAYKSDSTSRDIYLIMTGNDSLSGVDKMMISENFNFNNASFEEYKTSKAYTVSDSYGSKTIYVKFRDRAGNESNTYSTTVEYSQNILAPSITPNPTQVPASYGVTPIGNDNLVDGISIIALRLIGSSNNPLANVSINIPSLGINTTTDENGLIVIENIPLGYYDVLGIFNNKEFNQTVEVSPDNSLITIKLEDSPNTLTLVLGIFLFIVLVIAITLIMYVYLNRKKLINK